MTTHLSIDHQIQPSEQTELLLIKKPRKKRRKKKKAKKKRAVQMIHKLEAMPGPRIRKKICTECKESKRFSEYYKTYKKGRLNSYRSTCKKCDALKARKRIERTRKKKSQGGDALYQAYQRDYYHSHLEKFKEYRRAFLANNPDYFVKKSRERRLKMKQATIEAKYALNDKDCA